MTAIEYSLELQKHNTELCIEFAQPENDLEHQDWAESIVESDAPPALVPIETEKMQNDLRELYDHLLIVI